MTEIQNPKPGSRKWYSWLSNKYGHCPLAGDLFGSLRFVIWNLFVIFSRRLISLWLRCLLFGIS